MNRGYYGIRSYPRYSYNYYSWGYPSYWGFGSYPYFGYSSPYYYSSYYDPYYYGSYYDPYYYGSCYYSPSYVSAPSYAAPATPVVINQNYQPARVAPANLIAAPQEPFYRTPDFYLIAFNNHTIHAAIAYTVEGDTIRYTTREHEEKTAPLSSVDERFSEQINRDRRVEFRLP